MRSRRCVDAFTTTLFIDAPQQSRAGRSRPSGHHGAKITRASDAADRTATARWDHWATAAAFVCHALKALNRPKAITRTNPLDTDHHSGAAVEVRPPPWPPQFVSRRLGASWCNTMSLSCHFGSQSVTGHPRQRRRSRPGYHVRRRCSLRDGACGAAGHTIAANSDATAWVCCVISFL